MFVQHHHDSCLVVRNTSGLSSRLGTAIGMPLNVRRVTQVPFPIATVILGFLSIFLTSQALFPFESLNSAFLMSFQKDVRLPVQMRYGTRAYSRVSTGDSGIPSCCEGKHGLAFE